MKKKDKKLLKEFLEVVQEYNNFNKFVAENKEHFLGKHFLFTRDNKHKYKIMMSGREVIVDYLFENNFKFHNCVRYWTLALDTYWKNEVLTVSNINDDGFVQFEGRDENRHSWNSLWVFDEKSLDFKIKFTGHYSSWDSAYIDTCVAVQLEQETIYTFKEIKD